MEKYTIHNNFVGKVRGSPRRTGADATVPYVDTRQNRWYDFRHMTLWQGFKNLLFPCNCLLCQRDTHTSSFPHVCLTCISTIVRNSPPFCIRCSRHLEQYTADAVCPTCVKSAYHFDICWSAALYAGTIRTLIHHYKYGRKIWLTGVFAELAHEFLHTYHIDLTGFDAIVPVPLFAARLRERGFNQAELLSDALSERLGVPVLKGTVIRSFPTVNQAALGQKERWTNIRGAFRIQQPSQLIDKSILIVDDLLTTGATVSEIAGLLKAAGVNRVGVFTLAVAE